jgi:ATP-dependent DNA helicase RecG
LFDRPVERLTGVGPKVAERLAKLGVRTIGDLLCLLPQRYEDRTALRPIGGLSAGEKALVEGVVELSEVVVRRRRSLLCRLADGTGALTLRWFYFNRSLELGVARGQRLRCYGEVRPGPAGLEMVHPEHRAVRAEDDEPGDSLTPVYPTTEGLHQQTVRRLVARAVAALEHEPLDDYLAPALASRKLAGQPWPTLSTALRYLHAPPRDAATDQLLAGRHACLRRIALEELIAQRLILRRSAALARREHAASLPEPRAKLAALRASLPFALTRAQETALAEIVRDLGASAPMNRLLQGDVGSGKTIVAALAALVAAEAGCQTAVMAPTELLAEQHFSSFERWLAPLGIEVAPLVGAQGAQARAATLAAIAAGRVAVVVGTHALFQEAVAFKRLALVIVDEQHRFGVEQRLKLKQKGADGDLVPHQLIMTATPIPRTLAMTAYADLDCSVIGELPPGRQPVKTVALPEQRRAELVARVAAHCSTGQQAYWVCPLIEESELIDSQAASALERELREALPSVRIGLIHGRMKALDKDVVMRAFKSADLDLLVATTVIEVGVDVPNATLMVVENAERMGLAQLHQLRGRVGRGALAASCVLLYRPPLSDVARERLNVLRETNDGFAVAQKDLELRGPGEVLGTRQTGIEQLRVADLLRDADLLPTVIELSESLLAADGAASDALIRRWSRGTAEYAKV